MLYMYHSFLMHLSADGHLGCFHVLAIINSAAINIGVHVSPSDLVSSVCMPRSGIAGSYVSLLSLRCCSMCVPVLKDGQFRPQEELPWLHHFQPVGFSPCYVGTITYRLLSIIRVK